VRRGILRVVRPDPSLDPLIGRLIWVGVRGGGPGDPTLEAELDRCARAHAGGVILFDVDVPERDRLRGEGLAEAEARAGAPRNILAPEQARGLVRSLRARLGSGLIVSVDQEGGLVSRLGPARGFPASPSPRDYAAMPDDRRLDAARTLAGSVASVGIDLNLAPCVDVAVNPDGPGHTALGRSFGRDPARVAALAGEQIDAMHAAGVSCCLKHFPGHGSARGDTHLGLVDITETFDEAAELAPYRTLLGPARPCAGAPDAVMISHLVHRGYDADRPASLSAAVVTGLLRGRLGFDGLVLTDSLDMRAVADRFGAGEAAVLALEAGADVALEANNLSERIPCPAPEIHRAIRSAVDDGRLSVDRLEASAARLDAFLERRRARGAGP
jgi:beta-N-acetylhexosaminidase